MSAEATTSTIQKEECHESSQQSTRPGKGSSALQGRRKMGHIAETRKTGEESTLGAVGMLTKGEVMRRLPQNKFQRCLW